MEKITKYLGDKNISFFISTRKDDMWRNDFDIGISYCYPYLVDTERDNRKWYNYHPAPLPKYKGVRCIVDALNNKVDTYGVTLHVMTNEVDEGKIIASKTFSLSSIPCDANELGCIAHYHLFQLFKETICDLHTLGEIEIKARK